MKLPLYGLLLLFFVGPSCYRFNGITIDPSIKSYYVITFENKANNAPADLHLIFSELLRNKIRNQSTLKLTDENADITFEGELLNYNVVGEAPQEGNTVALNRLTIVYNVKYTNNINNKESFTRNFDFSLQFPSDQDLQNVQEELNKNINEQIAEKIFNACFNNW